ncbi:MAG: response regulator transcription factor [Kiritimatiellae bacterium]|nr:response regulator transcription factor [Kiritimatiellia bacterium]
MKNKTRQTRILFADDHQIVREGLARLIDREPDMKIVAEAENGIEAVRLMRELKPDLAILDLRMPAMDGAVAAKQILSDDPGAHILMLTSFATSEEVRLALDAGVLGAVVKDCSSESLIDAIRRAARGERVISPEIADTLAERRLAPTLSPRQKDILRLVAKGFNNEEIAQRIGISRHGVKAHLAIVFDRLNAASRAEATSLAISLGII